MRRSSIVVGFAFNDSPSVTRWSSFSLAWFEKVLANGDIHNAARNTLVIASCATIIATLIATAAALATTRSRAWPGQTTVYTFINLPLVVPEIVTAVATASFFALLVQQVGIAFGIRQPDPDPLRLLHPVRLPADPRPPRGYGLDPGAGRGRPLCDAVAGLPARDVAAADARHLVGRRARLHHFLRRFHHHPASSPAPARPPCRSTSGGSCTRSASHPRSTPSRQFCWWSRSCSFHCPSSSAVVADAEKSQHLQGENHEFAIVGGGCRRPVAGRRRRPRRRRLAHLQLGRLHQSQADREVPEAVQRQGHARRLRFRTRPCWRRCAPAAPATTSSCPPTTRSRS